MTKGKNPDRVYHYRIDLEGRLWIEDSEISDPQVLKFFMRKMETLPDGRFRVLCMGETNYIQAQDVPYVVQNLKVETDQIELIFPGNYREPLDPKTLWVGEKNVLYCKVRGGRFSARFNRKPYMEMAKLVEKGEGDQYYLQLGSKQYLIEGNYPTVPSPSGRGIG